MKRTIESTTASFSREVGCRLGRRAVDAVWWSGSLGEGSQPVPLTGFQSAIGRLLAANRSEEFGYQLHPLDLATNKVLALAGRDEPPDLLDTLYLHEHVLRLGSLVWAVVGKDPDYSPLSLLEMLRRRGRIQPAGLARLDLSGPVDLQQVKEAWLAALVEAERFVRAQPPGEAGCLYWSPSRNAFVCPEGGKSDDAVPHFGRPGGVLPRVVGD